VSKAINIVFSLRGEPNLIVAFGLKELINRLIVYYRLMFLEGIRELELVVLQRFGTHVLTLDLTATPFALDTA
jgi:hypothetical protein